MFKRKLEVRLVKDPGNNAATTQNAAESAQVFTEMVKDCVKILGIGVVVVTFAGIAMNVASEILLDRMID